MTSRTDGSIGTTTMALRSAFTRLSREDIDKLRQFATVKSYPADTILCREGEIEHTFYVLRSGAAKVTQRLSDTEERLLVIRGPGEFFGELALFEDSPRTASVTTIAPPDVIEITGQVFEQVLANSPALALTLLQRTQIDLRNTMQRQIAELQAKNEALEAAYRDLQQAQAQLLADARLKRDLELAAQLQRSILPTEFPQVKGLSFAAHAQPAREMGGDFYDVFLLDDQHLGLLVADVSDKSIPAAMFMAVSRTLFVTESRRSLSPREVVLSVNQLLLDLSSSGDMFVTAFYGVICLADRRLTYVRAGHDKPVWLHADGRIETLEGVGRFLGMLPDPPIEERSVTLQPGDRLVLYSDGIPDATDRLGQSYTVQRLKQIAAQHRSASASHLADAIFADVLAFQGDAPQYDDVTLLVAALDEAALLDEALLD